MTSQEISNIRINGQRDVSRPGKFEGEPIYSPYFYDRIMNGDGEYLGDDDGAIALDIDDDERRMFPELDGFSTVVTWEDGNGFFYCVPGDLID